MAQYLKNNKFSKIDIELDHIKCDFCGSDQNSLILTSKDYVFNNIQGEFNIVKCENCKLAFSNPRLRNDQMKNHYYITDDFGSPIEKVDLINQKSYVYNKNFLVNYFNYPFGKRNLRYKFIHYPLYLRINKKWKKTLFIPKYIKNGKILEIGCSYGNYLFQLKKIGWDVKGIELSKKAVDHGKNKLNLDILNIDIQDFESEENFDIIYLRMVLEHVESPKIVLKKCYSLLKPHGKLVLILPDISGLEVRIYKKYAYTLTLPYHLYHFSPNTIKNYLKLLDFHNIKIVHENFDRDLLAPLNFMIRENPNKLYLKVILKFATKGLIRKVIIKTIVNIFSLLGKTSRMTVIAEK